MVRRIWGSCHVPPLLSQFNVRGEIQLYENVRAKITRSDQNVTSEIRQGRITGVQANKDFFSFSLKMIDEAVESETPAYRNFCLLDVHGEKADGWGNLQLSGDLEEEELALLNSTDFVLPERYQDITQDHYILTKMAITRLTQQAKFITAEVKRLKQDGFTLPSTPSVEYSSAPSQSVDVETLLTEIDHSFITTGAYTPYPDSNESLAEANKLKNHISYSLIPSLRYYTRVIEYAFHLYGGFNTVGWGSVQLKRTVWNTLDLTEGVTLRV